MRKKVVLFIVSLIIILSIIILGINNFFGWKSNVSNNDKLDSSQNQKNTSLDKKEDTNNNNNNNNNENNQKDSKVDKNDNQNKETILNNIPKITNNNIEEIISNYERLFPDVVNDNDVNFSLLDNVLINNSKFYNNQKKQVEEFKKENVKYKVNVFEIKDISKISETEFIVNVIENISLQSGGKEKDVNKKYDCLYTVKYVDSKLGIIDRTIK